MLHILESIGIKLKVFGLHSLHWGGTTRAVNNYMTDYDAIFFTRYSSAHEIHNGNRCMKTLISFFLFFNRSGRVNFSNSSVEAMHCVSSKTNSVILCQVLFQSKSLKYTVLIFHLNQKASIFDPMIKFKFPVKFY